MPLKDIGLVLTHHISMILTVDNPQGFGVRRIMSDKSFHRRLKQFYDSQLSRACVLQCAFDSAKLELLIFCLLNLFPFFMNLAVKIYTTDFFDSVP